MMEANPIVPGVGVVHIDRQLICANTWVVSMLSSTGLDDTGAEGKSNPPIETPQHRPRPLSPVFTPKWNFGTSKQDDWSYK